MATKTELINNVLNLLRSNLGTGETPPGSNHNFITEWYNAEIDKIGNGPWCEMTVTWAMHTAGAGALKVPRAYTVYAVADAMGRKRGTKWVYGTEGIAAGDSVYFDWSGQKGNFRTVDHVGTIEKVNRNGTYYVLEGNQNDVLKRVLRDDKYIVGYVRYAWDSLEATPAPVIPKPTPAPPQTNPIIVSLIQGALEGVRSGVWDSKTDARAMVMRAAARAHVGWPKNVPGGRYDVEFVQNIVDTKPDGEWGKNTQAAMVAWVKGIQTILQIDDDGQWGPATDNAFLTLRKKYLTK